MKYSTASITLAISLKKLLLRISSIKVQGLGLELDHPTNKLARFRSSQLLKKLLSKEKRAFI